jgi:hypothetical protein
MGWILRDCEGCLRIGRYGVSRVRGYGNVRNAGVLFVRGSLQSGSGTGSEIGPFGVLERNAFRCTREVNAFRCAEQSAREECLLVCSGGMPFGLLARNALQCAREECRGPVCKDPRSGSGTQSGSGSERVWIRDSDRARLNSAPIN